MKRLTTVDQVLDAFGGNATVASWLGLRTSAVCNWRERAGIPSGWHLRFYLEAQKRGIEIDKTIFGLGDYDPAPDVKPVKKKRGVKNALSVRATAA